MCCLYFSYKQQKPNCQHQQSSRQHTSTKHGERHVSSRNTEETCKTTVPLGKKWKIYLQASCIHDGHIVMLQQGVNAPEGEALPWYHWDDCCDQARKLLFICAYCLNSTSRIASRTTNRTHNSKDRMWNLSLIFLLLSSFLRSATQIHIFLLALDAP